MSDFVTPGRDTPSTQQERCGLWVGIAGEDFVCMRSPDHTGECLPLRSSVLNQAEALEEKARGLYDAVAAVGQDGGWPYEGPTS